MLSSRRIVLTAGQIVLRRGGVIRSVANWGEFSLPRAVARAQMRHHKGHYFVMRYDGSAAAQAEVRATLGLDPRVIRSATVKLGDGKLETLSRFGDVLWKGAFERSYGQ